LGSHPFTADPVKITVTNFKGSAVFATKLSRHLLGSIHIEVENTSNNFATFEPQHFSVSVG
jgi:hypothetical protein